MRPDAPRRVQRKRAAGWRMPANTVYVGRPTMWGNPFTVGKPGIPDAAEAVRRFSGAVVGFWTGGDYYRPVAHPDSVIGRIIREAPIQLRGRHLACWCALDQPCHADVLLELANGPSCDRMEQRDA